MLQNMINFCYLQSLQVLFVHILIFVSWKKGPIWWLNLAPKLFIGLAIVNYLAIPLIVGFYSH